MKPLFGNNSYPSLAREIFGIEFRHPIGLPPGFLPDGDHVSAFRKYSFVEVGPLTVLPQGDPVTHGLFRKRSVKDGMADNRGVGYAIQRLNRAELGTTVAANLAPSFVHRSTEEIVRDLTTAFTMMYDFADMFVIDTFRANCDGSVALQNIDILSEVLDSILDMRTCYEDPKPILVRVLPSISRSVLGEILDYMRLYGVDGIVAGYRDYPVDLVRDISAMTKGRYPVVACGGVDDPLKAAGLLSAGADLVQAAVSPRRILKYLGSTAHGAAPSK